MPNVSRVFGLRMTKSLTGPTMGNLETFSVLSSDATALFVGDLVKSSGTADANGVQSITRVTTNADLPVGVITGFLPDYSNLNTPQGFRAASTARMAQLIIDPAAIFEVQATAATALADIGLNVGVTFTAGSSTTGLSGMVADMTTKATSAGLPLKIVGVVQRPDQDMADSANWKLLVTLNTNNFGGNTAGV